MHNVIFPRGFRVFAIGLSLFSALALLAGSLYAAPTPPAKDSPQLPAKQPTVELSAEQCSKNLTDEQLNVLVDSILRKDTSSPTKACYWALSNEDQARVGEALLLAKGMTREQIAREAEKNARRADECTTCATIPFGTQSTGFATHRPFGTNTGTGTLSNRYYENNGCDGDPSDYDWEYVFPLSVSSQDELGRLYYYNTDIYVDAILKWAYEDSGILTFGVYGLSTTSACMGTAANLAGLLETSLSLHLYMQ